MRRIGRLFSADARFNIRLDIVRYFGDGWEHEITVEKILPADPGRAYPTCVDGKQHGPPEDCGGVSGFYNLLEAIGDPTHDQHEELLGGGR